MFDILKLAIEFISIFAKFTSSRKFHCIYYKGIREVYIKLSYVHIFKMQCKEFVCLSDHNSGTHGQICLKF